MRKPSPLVSIPWGVLVALTAFGLAATPLVAGQARLAVADAPQVLNAARDTAAIVAYPSSSPQSAATADLVTNLRDSVAPPLERASGAAIYIGGTTASQSDFSHVLSSKLPLFIAVVIGLSALLLLIVFRSLVIPVQAAAMNLLRRAVDRDMNFRARLRTRRLVSRRVAFSVFHFRFTSFI